MSFAKKEQGKQKRETRLCFFHRIAKDKRYGRVIADSGRGSTQIYLLFPPRRIWHRYRPRVRQGRTSVDLNARAIYLAAMALRNQSPQAAWAVRLGEFVERVKRRVLQSHSFRFAAPRIVPVEKDRKKSTYRPVALFDQLDDKIVDCLTARYLRESLDSVLLPSCWAFRCRSSNGAPPTIHDALTKLLDLRSKYASLYVAECDIKAFFDCVPHRVAVESIDDLIAEKRSIDKSSVVDERALRILQAYVAAYSFRKTVMGVALESLRKHRDPKASFPWPEDDLRSFHGEGVLDEIGVPQGGALSCLIANAVLHKADKALRELSTREGASFTYLRYCDDMILLAEKEGVCREAFDLYAREVKSRFLPIHQPKHPGLYSEKFYEGKSHLPYLWGPKDTIVGIPWIQFVGYQIRHDGLVRVRLKSLKKELRKITSTADELLNLLRLGSKNTSLAAHIRKSRRQIKHRFQQKLISMSVGRIILGPSRQGLMPMCWASGFRGLKSRRIVLTTLKILDRHRERQIARVVRALSVLSAPRRGPAEARKSDVLPFYGCPFSDWSQFRERP